MKLRVILFLTLLIAISIPFSCEDKNECLDLYADPYFDIQSIDFINVVTYSYSDNGNIFNPRPTEQDYDNMVYAGDSLGLFFQAKNLNYHSKYTPKPWFSLIPEAYACNPKRPGYNGTKEKVDRIIITSLYDFDETHNKNDNLSDIVDIFAYSNSEEGNSRMLLDEYNKNSPYQAPKRFYLLLKRKPTRSMTHKFIIKYSMKTEQGEANEVYDVETPTFHLK